MKEKEDKKGDEALGNEHVGSKTKLCAWVVCGIVSFGFEIRRNVNCGP